MSEPITWKFEILDPVALRKSLKQLSQKQYFDLLEHIGASLSILGLRVFQTGAAKWLGGGLAELRYRENPDVLVRVFFCIRNGEFILLLSAYDKKRDPSVKRQQAEIKLARKIMKGL